MFLMLYSITLLALYFFLWESGPVRVLAGNRCHDKRAKFEEMYFQRNYLLKHVGSKGRTGDGVGTRAKSSGSLTPPAPKRQGTVTENRKWHATFRVATTSPRGPHKVEAMRIQGQPSSLTSP